MIITIVFLIAGAAIFIGGLYYMLKERHDAQSKKIYVATSLIGAAVTAATVLKIVLLGLGE